MMRRRLTVAAVCTAIAVTACVDMSAPKGPASISVLQLPALFVVRGDVMRDSLGNPAPPQLIAYDPDGNATGAADAQFFVTDSNAVARFDNGVLAGRALGVVHVVGQIGSLQTTAVPVNVTVQPTSFTAPRAPDTLRAPVGTDSATSTGSAALGTIVRGAGDTAVAGVFVRYRLVRALDSTGTSPAVFLADDAGNRSTIDTTDLGGNASRRVVVVSRHLADSALVTGQTVDSVVVEAHTMYRGSELPGGPIRFVVPVKVTFALP
jgi:hypothetical protein